MPAGNVRIIARPEGEAPEWVRDAWIGVRVPLVRREILRTGGFGVVTGPKTWLGQMLGCLTGQAFPATGYLVDAAQAVEMLAWTRPDAATWWRENGGGLIRPGRSFVFDAPACELVD
jgi:hypothetical protein